MVEVQLLISGVASDDQGSSCPQGSACNLSPVCTYVCTYVRVKSRQRGISRQARGVIGKTIKPQGITEGFVSGRRFSSSFAASDLYVQSTYLIIMSKR